MKNENKAGPEKASKPELGHPLFDWRPLVFTLLLFALYYNFGQGEQNKPRAIPYSEFKQQLHNNQVAKVQITGYNITGTTHSKEQENSDSFDFKTRIPSFGDDALLPELDQNNVEIEVRSEESPWWASLLIGVLPWVLIFGLFAYSNRALQSKMGGGSGMFGFSGSRAKLYEHLNDQLGFDDVAGLDGAKQDLREVIEFLKNPDKFRRLGATLPKGVLMMGPPGTGKTLLARATAAEANVPFFSISGSEFVEMFVGVGAGRVRDMFKQAREKAPALIFVDEIDSVGRVRGTGVGGGNDEREQTLNQILAEMDGFSSSDPIVVLAATNRPDVLDPALLRPGRFDRKITLDLPQKQARRQILEVHTRHKPIAESVDLDSLAARTIGFSGADLENLVNEAALHAASENQDHIEVADFEHAHDKIILGDKRQDILSVKDKERIAYHEAGHAIMSLYLPTADPLSKITIIPRGRSLGMTETMPTEDRVNYAQDFLEDRLCMLLGGRCSEQLIFGNPSSGAADDLKKCTQLARRMITEWGMSETLGPLYLAQHEEHPFLGMEMATAKEFSDATAHTIDEEVAKLIKKSEHRSQTLLSEKRVQLDALAQALISQETLSIDEIRQLLAEQVKN